MNDSLPAGLLPTEFFLQAKIITNSSAASAKANLRLVLMCGFCSVKDKQIPKEQTADLRCSLQLKFNKIVLRIAYFE